MKKKKNINYNSNKKYFQSLVNLKKLFRIYLSDQRIIIGEFYCLDQYQNIILNDSIEFRYYNNKKILLHHQRKLGMVMIPGNHILKCQVLNE